MLKQIRKLLINFGQQWRDEDFMRSIHLIENIVSKVLSVALIVVIIVSLYDLVVILIKDLFTTEPVGFFSKTLIEIFGLFLNILIALELLENVTAYLRKHIVQVELVVVTALIAISRKIIAVPQGYIHDTKEALDEYKKQYSDYWNQVLGGFGEETLPLGVCRQHDEAKILPCMLQHHH